MNKGLALILVIVVLIFSLFLGVDSMLAQDTGGETDLSAPIGIKDKLSLGEYIPVIYNFFVVLGVSLAILVIIFAGYKYMMSSGDPQSLEESKELLVGAIVGLILIFLTRLILGSIDARLLQFNTGPPEIGETMQDMKDAADSP